MIRRIFSVLGTPDESTWPGVSKLEGMKAKFKISSPQPLSNFVHKNLIGEYGLDLLEKMLTLDPLQRIDAVNALNHPYFSDMQVQ
jgi:serine/threonine protein kinase